MADNYYNNSSDTIKLLVDATVNSLRELSVVLNQNTETLKRLEERALKHDDNIVSFTDAIRENNKALQEVPEILKNFEKSLTAIKENIEGNEKFQQDGMARELKHIYLHTKDVQKFFKVLKDPVPMAIAILLVLGTLVGMYEGFNIIVNLIHASPIKHP